MNSNLYPFATKAQIKTQIDSDPEFARECLLVIHARQTEVEQEKKETINKNRRGFMSSHAVRGTELARKILGAEYLNPEEEELVVSIARSYTKQLASHFRQVTLEEKPELAEQAKVFGL
jgi:pyruvate/2-oxoglutarate dehydrogenase complex dihydrolipoamide dehydrogenase (E3) component